MIRPLARGLGSTWWAPGGKQRPCLPEQLDLEIEQSGVQGVCGVLGSDLELDLGDDVSGVDPAVHEMEGGADRCLVEDGPIRGVPAPVVGQQRRMEVEHTDPGNLED